MDIVIVYLLIGVGWMLWERSRPVWKQPPLLWTSFGPLLIVLIWPVRAVVKLLDRGEPPETGAGQ